MAKHGIENFTFEVVDFASNLWEADCIEAGLIIRYDSRNTERGYNISSGGPSPHAPREIGFNEPREFIPWNKGLPKELNPRTGTTLSEEHKAQISSTLMGHAVSDETRAKNSAAHLGHEAWNKGLPKELNPLTGRTMSEEHKAKIGESQKGKVIPAETRAKISATLTGRKLAPEHVAKCAEANRHPRKPHLCKDCGETNPDNFYTAQKSRCKACVIARQKAA
jgi:hypothetical protein